MIYTFNFPGATVSQNILDGAHWAVKHQEKTYWHNTVHYLAGRCPTKPRKASVSFVRVSKRLIDPLNVYAGLKWILDALVLKGWLLGDGYGQVKVFADQRKCEKGEEPHVEVTIAYE